jgi:hypothetical protein
MTGRPTLVACVASLALLCGALACATTRGPRGVLERIEDAAHEAGCTPLGAGADEDGSPDPWWVPLQTLTGDAGASAFLCSSRIDSATLVVVDVRSDRNPWAGCPSVVGELAWRPVGLSILTPGNPAYPAGTLAAWKDRTGAAGAEDTWLTKPVVDTSAQIAGSLFYCHEGRWLTLFVH